MKILVVGKGDWSGAGYQLMKAINETTNHEARAISFTQPGSYTKYDYDIIDPGFDELRKWWNWADVVNIHDNAEDIFPIDVDVKPVIETYHGSWYRSDPEKINKLARNRGRIQTCLTQDLALFGPRLHVRAVEDLSPEYDKDTEKFIVFHSPTNRKLKGTDWLIEELQPLVDDGVIDLQVFEKGTNAECMAAKSRASLFIDQSPAGVSTGFGTNALEAWSLGIPVITDMNSDVYSVLEARIGEGNVPFASVDSCELSFVDLVNKFVSDDAFREEYIDKGRDYIKRFHSNSVVAEEFVSICSEAIEKFEPTEDGVPITLCMIMKNEYGRINQAISSARGLTKDVVIADTGSTDESIKCCRDLGCTVITGADYMNKAESRNTAIENASGDWVVILDADEIITDPIALRRKINEMDKAGIGGGPIIAGCSMGHGGVPTEKFNQMRVWRKDLYRYRYRAHELPNLVDPDGNSSVWNIPVLFAHYPDRSNAHTAWKLQYTLDRLLLDIEDYPDAARPRYYIGRQYVYLGEYDKAIVNLDEFLKMTKVSGHWDRPNACMDMYKCYIEMSNKEEDKELKSDLVAKSIEWLYSACYENPTNKKWWFELANRYYALGKHDLVVGLISLMFALPVENQWGYRATICEGPDPLDLMARSFWKLGKYRAGYECAKKALDMDKNNKRLKDNLQFFIDKLDVMV